MSGRLLTARDRERFWSKVDLTGPDGCWLWMAADNGKGYGQFRLGAKVLYAHRIAYELLAGSIPDGLDLDHLCRVPACVNPEHLEPVTRRENVRRSPLMRGKTHCVHGHEFTPENTYVTKTGGRQCRTCNRRRNRARRTWERGAT